MGEPFFFDRLRIVPSRGGSSSRNLFLCIIVDDVYWGMGDLVVVAMYISLCIFYSDIVFTQFALQFYMYSIYWRARTHHRLLNTTVGITW